MTKNDAGVNSSLVCISTSEYALTYDAEKKRFGSSIQSHNLFNKLKVKGKAHTKIQRRPNKSWLFRLALSSTNKPYPHFHWLLKVQRSSGNKEKKPKTTTTKHQKKQVGKTGLAVLQCYVSALYQKAHLPPFIHSPWIQCKEHSFSFSVQSDKKKKTLIQNLLLAETSVLQTVLIGAQPTAVSTQSSDSLIESSTLLVLETDSLKDVEKWSYC